MNKSRLVILIGCILALICVIVGFILIENYLKTAANIVACVGIVLVLIVEFLIFKKA